MSSPHTTSHRSRWFDPRTIVALIFAVVVGLGALPHSHEETDHDTHGHAECALCLALSSVAHAVPPLGYTIPPPLGDGELMLGTAPWERKERARFAPPARGPPPLR